MTLADELANLPDPPLQERAKGFLLREDEPVTAAQLQDAWDEGFRFTMIQASRGLDADTQFTAHWGAAGQVGFLRAVFHWLDAIAEGQAAHFASILDGRVPEMGFYMTASNDATLAKAEQFYSSADLLLGQTVHARTTRNWLDSRGGAPWQAEGRRLCIINTSDADEPVLPDSYDDWDTWQNRVESPAWSPYTLRFMVYNGDDAELYAEYGGDNEQVIAELLLAQAKNAEVAAHIANALALLQGQQ
jgi:hypothetical protein